MSLKVVKKVKAKGGESRSNTRQFVRCKIATRAFAATCQSGPQMGPEKAVSSGSDGFFAPPSGRRNAP
ncbi:hypothetical protein [Paraburkholderia sp. HP33-1]|uniref:hypothetical protein n=1 Tax=Paraburkholderia sp. HP33-1 TaxID=2883243 RepID=UPI001F36D0B5|nr:hypothetical protein [Paraburkholderia sp. HP33-1]